MLAAVRSAAVLGVEAFDVTVEVDCTRGLQTWTIVGMPASSVKVACERVAGRLLTHDVRRTLVLPKANVAEASLVRDLATCAPASIAELLGWLQAGTLPRAERVNGRATESQAADFGEVVGQESAKRALE